MAKGKGVLDSTEFLLLILGTFGAIIVVAAVSILYTRRQRIAKRLQNFTLSLRRYGQRRKIDQLLRQRPRDELIKIALSIAVWPKAGFPDEVLYIPRPSHYDPRLKYPDRYAPAESIDRTVQLASGRSRRDLLKVIRRALRNRSLRSLSWIYQCLAEKIPSHARER